MSRAMTLTRYVSPFGSPATMSRDRAEEIRRQDAAMWRLLADLDLLTERQRRIGEPRVDDTTFRLGDLPEWRRPDPDADPWDLIRELVAVAERRARDRGEGYVVVERAEGLGVLPARLVVDGDAVRWEARP